MSINVSYDVRTAAGTSPLGNHRAMPVLPDARQWDMPIADRIGYGVADHPWLVAAAGLIGLVGGFSGIRAFRHTIPLPLLGGIAGGVLGAFGGAALLGAGAVNRARTAPPGAPGGAERPRPSARPTQDEQLKVMTFNLHGGMGPDNDFSSSDADLDAIAEVIRRESPDIVCLQEVDLDAKRSSHRDVLAELARRVHPDSAVAATPYALVTGRTQHVAVMTFNGNTVDSARNIIHEDPRGTGVMRRIGSVFGAGIKFVDEHVLHRSPPSLDYATRNTIDTIVHTRAGNDVRVLSGHYNWNTNSTDHQSGSSLLMARELDAWRGPTILAADFNIGSGSESYDRERDAFAASGLAEAFEAVGVPRDDAVRGSTIETLAPIDRIYASSQFTVDGTRVVQEDHPASDHHPVVATLTLHAEEGASGR